MPTPIDPDPRIRSHKKAPPILIKFNNSNTISNYTTDSFLNARSVNKNYDTKDINAVLPPIKFKTLKQIFRSRLFLLLRPSIGIYLVSSKKCPIITLNTTSRGLID